MTETVPITVGGNTAPIHFTKEMIKQLREARHEALGKGLHTFTWNGRDWCCAPDNDIARCVIDLAEFSFKMKSHLRFSSTPEQIEKHLKGKTP